jgi:hypothetical protein
LFILIKVIIISIQYHGGGLLLHKTGVIIENNNFL